MPEEKSHLPTSVARLGSVKPEWPKLTLFIPVFPAGEAELNRVLLRSLKFFWPKSSLRILFIADEEIPRSTRDPFIDRLIKSMEKHAISVEARFNYVPTEVYTSGQDRQQLIVLWADNFTSSEYVGIIDDDTLITNHVLREDVFDERNRPRVWGRSWNRIRTWDKVMETTRWTDNSDMEIMRTMNYFPVVVKTSHLKVVRDSVLKHHPEFVNFDDFFKRGHNEQRRAFSQYNLIHQHLWKLRNDDYKWHLQAASATDNHFKRIKGVTEEMMFPAPKSALHFNYDRRPNKPKKFLEDIFKRGFCYSLTKKELEADSEHAQLCRKEGYTWGVVSAVPDIDHWIFEDMDWRWDNRTTEAHRNRIALNKERADWDEKELKLIFEK